MKGVCSSTISPMQLCRWQTGSMAISEHVLAKLFLKPFCSAMKRSCNPIAQLSGVSRIFTSYSCCEETTISGPRPVA